MTKSTSPELPAPIHPAPENSISQSGPLPTSPCSPTTTLIKPTSPRSQSMEWPQTNLSSPTPARQPIMNIDLEKDIIGDAPFRRTQTWNTVDDELKYEEDEQTVRDHAMSILVYLSGPVFFLNLLGALWSFIALPLISISHPCHLVGCNRRTSSLRSRLVNALEPFISFNLHFIYASARTRVPAAYSISRLMCVLLLSPLFSIGISLAAWTAACFWLFAAILGDPKGTEEQEKRNSSLTDKDDNDGKDSVMWCRRVWRDWILKCIY